MLRYAAFLRGMNLGGRRIANEDLRTHVAAVGFQDVAVFRASGNVIFSAPDGEPPDEVSDRLEGELGKALGYDVPVFLRTAAQVLGIAAHEPFNAELVAASKGKLQVSLLRAKPPRAAREQALALATGEDRLAIRETELYWLPSGGISDSALDLKALEKLLGASTIRTKGTIDLIASKHFAG